MLLQNAAPKTAAPAAEEVVQVRQETTRRLVACSHTTRAIRHTSYPFTLDFLGEVWFSAPCVQIMGGCRSLFEPRWRSRIQRNTQTPSNVRTYCLCRGQMILRVFWPCSDLGQTACLLLGAVLHSTLKSQAVTTAVIISAIPLHLLPAAPEVQQHLSDCHVAVPLAPAPAQATLAVLGVWQPLEATSSSPGPPAAGQHGLWLVLQGRQGLSETLAGSSCWRAQQLWAPACDLQQCDLPPDTESIQVCSYYPPPRQLGNREHGLVMYHTPVPVQVFLYAVPAQQLRCASVRLPLPPPAPQLPWMKQQPGESIRSTPTDPRVPADRAMSSAVQQLAGLGATAALFHTGSGICVLVCCRSCQPVFCPAHAARGTCCTTHDTAAAAAAAGAAAPASPHQDAAPACPTDPQCSAQHASKWLGTLGCCPGCS